MEVATLAGLDEMRAVRKRYGTERLGLEKKGLVRKDRQSSLSFCLRSIICCLFYFVCFESNPAAARNDSKDACGYSTNCPWGWPSSLVRVSGNSWRQKKYHSSRAFASHRRIITRRLLTLSTRTRARHLMHSSPNISEPRVMDIMASRGLRATNEVLETSSVMDAVRLLTERRVGSALCVRNDGGGVSGVFTARDLVRWLSEECNDRPERAVKALHAPVSTIATPAEKIAWCAPRDKLTRVRMVMRARGVRNLPVVCTATGAVLGVLTAKDVADFSLERQAEPTLLGGKEAFLRATSGRSGLPPEATVTDAPTRRHIVNRLSGDTNHVDQTTPSSLLLDDADAIVNLRAKTVPPPKLTPRREARLELQVGAFALPNAYKRSDGTVVSRNRDAEIINDAELSEDAHLVIDSRYAGVFDGVGSWRKVGVDPRVYPRTLAGYCAEHLERWWLNDPHRPPPRPLDVLLDAWRRISTERIPGSTTACLATLDPDVDSLSYVNLGDAGILVLRDRTLLPRFAGTGSIKKDNNASGWAVVLVSAQQLRDFNLPYQLGWTNTGHDDAAGATLTFETPLHANVATFPVLAGDLIIIATDGLYDNVSVDEIVELVANWDSHFSRRRSSGANDLNDLAAHLCTRARDFSLDENRDSPFALLAKENDIMYGGTLCSFFLWASLEAPHEQAGCRTT